MSEALPQPGPAHLHLRQVRDRIELHSDGARGPVYVDFTEARSQARSRGHKRAENPLARAVGARKPLPFVMDATAGLGRDCMALCRLGYRVLAAERDACLHALLSDGLRRAATAPDLVEAAARLELRHGDAREVLAAAEQPECIYLDPMFPPRSNSALVKKEMQVFQELLGHEDPTESQALFAWARRRASLRVVVKRPRTAPALHAGPSYSVTSKKIRWDVYLRSTTDAASATKPSCS